MTKKNFQKKSYLMNHGYYRPKMYKSKKNWIIVGMTILSLMGGASLAQKFNVHADNINNKLNNQSNRQNNSNINNSKPTIKNIQSQASNLHNRIMNNNSAYQNSKVISQNTKAKNFVPQDIQERINQKSALNNQNNNLISDNPSKSNINNISKKTFKGSSNIDSSNSNNSTNNNNQSSSKGSKNNSSSKVGTRCTMTHKNNRRAKRNIKKAKNNIYKRAKLNPITLGHGNLHQRITAHGKRFTAYQKPYVVQDDGNKYPYNSHTSRNFNGKYSDLVSQKQAKQIKRSNQQNSDKASLMKITPANEVYLGGFNKNQRQKIMDVNINNEVGDSNRATDSDAKYFSGGIEKTGSDDGLNYTLYNNGGLEFTSGVADSDLSSFQYYIESDILGVNQYYNFPSDVDAVKFDSDVDTNRVTNMSKMFWHNTDLKVVDLSNLDASNVTNMSDMFTNDSDLRKIIIPNSFNTSNVNDMARMFNEDRTLQSLTLPDSFNTSNVTNMFCMFLGDWELHSLKLDKNFDTSNVTGMGASDLFSDSLEKLVIQSPKTKLFDSGLSPMYKELTTKDSNGNSYTSIIPNDFSKGNVGTFSSIKNPNPQQLYNYVDIYGNSDNFNIPKAVHQKNINKVPSDTTSIHSDSDFLGDIHWTFVSNESGKISSKPHFDNQGRIMIAPIYKGLVYDYNKNDNSVTFTNGKADSDLNHFTFNFPSDIQNATSINFGSDINTKNVKNMSDMFANDYSLQSINFGKSFNTSDVTNMGCMFESSYKLQSLDLSDFNTSNVNDMNTMFAEDYSLQSINFGNHFDTSNVTNMSLMFYRDKSLQYLNLPNSFNTNKVYNMPEMFQSDSSLQSLTLPNSFNTSNVQNMSDMFASDNALQSLTLPNSFDTSKVSDMLSMFSNDTSLTSLELPSAFNTTNTGTMGMFHNVPLQKLILDGTQATFSDKSNLPTMYKEIGGSNSNGPYTESNAHDFTNGEVGIYITKKNVKQNTKDIIIKLNYIFHGKQEYFSSYGNEVPASDVNTNTPNDDSYYLHRIKLPLNKLVSVRDIWSKITEGNSDENGFYPLSDDKTINITKDTPRIISINVTSPDIILRYHVNNEVISKPLLISKGKENSSDIPHKRYNEFIINSLISQISGHRDISSDAIAFSDLTETSDNSINARTLDNDIKNLSTYKVGKISDDNRIVYSNNIRTFGNVAWSSVPHTIDLYLQPNLVKTNINVTYDNDSDKELQLTNPTIKKLGKNQLVYNHQKISDTIQNEFSILCYQNPNLKNYNLNKENSTLSDIHVNTSPIIVHIINDSDNQEIATKIHYGVINTSLDSEHENSDHLRLTTLDSDFNNKDYKIDDKETFDDIRNQQSDGRSDDTNDSAPTFYFPGYAKGNNIHNNAYIHVSKSLYDKPIRVIYENNNQVLINSNLKITYSDQISYNNKKYSDNTSNEYNILQDENSELNKYHLDNVTNNTFYVSTPSVTVHIINESSNKEISRQTHNGIINPQNPSDSNSYINLTKLYPHILNTVIDNTLTKKKDNISDNLDNGTRDSVDKFYFPSIKSPIPKNAYIYIRNNYAYNSNNIKIQYISPGTNHVAKALNTPFNIKSQNLVNTSDLLHQLQLQNKLPQYAIGTSPNSVIQYLSTQSNNNSNIEESSNLNPQVHYTINLTSPTIAIKYIDTNTNQVIAHGSISDDNNNSNPISSQFGGDSFVNTGNQTNGVSNMNSTISKHFLGKNSNTDTVKEVQVLDNQEKDNAKELIVHYVTNNPTSNNTSLHEIDESSHKFTSNTPAIINDYINPIFNANVFKNQDVNPIPVSVFDSDGNELVNPNRLHGRIDKSSDIKLTLQKPVTNIYVQMKQKYADGHIAYIPGFSDNNATNNRKYNNTINSINTYSPTDNHHVNWDTIPHTINVYLESSNDNPERTIYGAVKVIYHTGADYKKGYGYNNENGKAYASDDENDESDIAGIVKEVSLIAKGRVKSSDSLANYLTNGQNSIGSQFDNGTIDGFNTQNFVPDSDNNNILNEKFNFKTLQNMAKNKTPLLLLYQAKPASVLVKFYDGDNPTPNNIVGQRIFNGTNDTSDIDITLPQSDIGSGPDRYPTNALGLDSSDSFTGKNYAVLEDSDSDDVYSLKYGNDTNSSTKGNINNHPQNFYDPNEKCYFIKVGLIDDGGSDSTDPYNIPINVNNHIVSPEKVRRANVKVNPGVLKSVSTKFSMTRSKKHNKGRCTFSRKATILPKKKFIYINRHKK